MRKRLPKIVFSGLLLAALVLGGFPGDAQAKVREAFEQTIPFEATGHFSIDNVNGSITIETWNDGSVQIKAEKVADSEESLRDIEIEVSGSGDRVSVRTHLPKGRRGESRAVEYHIMLPATANVDVETVNGRVEVIGVQGRLDASTVNGSVEVEGIGAQADVSTTNGSIKAHYNDAVDGTHKFSTTNGSVTLYLPDGASGELDASTVNGSITTDFPATVNRMSKRRLKGSFGGGGGSLFEISTVNGSVKIRKN